MLLSLLSYFEKNESRLLRSRCLCECACVCVCVSPLSFLGESSVKIPPIVARQRLGRNVTAIACVFVRAVTFLLSLCLTTVGIFLPSCCLATIKGYFPSRCLATIGGYTDTHTHRDLISVLRIIFNVACVVSRKIGD
jgi:hypothetical protein